jgi:hypothetical protein
LTVGCNYMGPYEKCQIRDETSAKLVELLHEFYPIRQIIKMLMS